MTINSPLVSPPLKSIQKINMLCELMTNHKTVSSMMKSPVQDSIKEQRLKRIKEMQSQSMGKLEIIPPLIPMNGISYFIRPLYRLHIQYCSHYKCSISLMEFMKKRLVSIAQDFKSVEFVVESRWSQRPIFRAFYLSGYQKTIDLSSKTCHEIEQTWNMLKDELGRKDRKFKPGVVSMNHAIRPIWSPFHHEHNHTLSEIKQIC